ncbi:MAG TPA: SEC-C metal-binding domain-containing protein, partial [Stellaceae bacterium]|nr:SEC-C metal-binding domain-containing protein [Stellaceae bacterium]
VAAAVPDNALPEQWDMAGLHAECQRLLALDLPLAEWVQEEGIDREAVEDRIVAAADRHMAEKAANYGTELMRMAEKSLLLQLLDHTWKDHLLTLDHLRQGINLRAYAQVDPLNEYKREAFHLFEAMLAGLRDQVTSVLSHVELRLGPPDPEPTPFGELSYSESMPFEREEALVEAGGRPATRGGNGAARARGRPRGNGAADPRRHEEGDGLAAAAAAAPRAPWGGTGRNAPCPCGSGRKYKHCHGRL